MGPGGTNSLSSGSSYGPLRCPSPAPLPSHNRYVAVSLLPAGLHHTVYCVVQSKSPVGDVWEQMCRFLGNPDPNPFGLGIEIDNEFLFLELDSKLLKYASKAWRNSSRNGLDTDNQPLLTLHLRIQYYMDWHFLRWDRLVREHYYHQLRLNVMQGRLSGCLSGDGMGENAAQPFLLAGYALQADLGPYCSRVHRGAYFDPQLYFPPHILSSLGTLHVLEQSTRVHKNPAVSQLTRLEAQLAYLREASRPPSPYNMCLFSLRTGRSVHSHSALLGLSANGLTIFQEKAAGEDKYEVTAELSWPSIMKLSFEKKKFEVRTGSEKYTFWASNEMKARLLLSHCRRTHQFSMGLQCKSPSHSSGDSTSSSSNEQQGEKRKKSIVGDCNSTKTKCSSTPSKSEPPPEKNVSSGDKLPLPSPLKDDNSCAHKSKTGNNGKGSEWSSRSSSQMCIPASVADAGANRSRTKSTGETENAGDVQKNPSTSEGNTNGEGGGEETKGNVCSHCGTLLDVCDEDACNGGWIDREVCVQCAAADHICDCDLNGTYQCENMCMKTPCDSLGCVIDSMLEREDPDDLATVSNRIQCVVNCHCCSEQDDEEEVGEVTGQEDPVLKTSGSIEQKVSKDGAKDLNGGEGAYVDFLNRSQQSQGGIGINEASLPIPVSTSSNPQPQGESKDNLLDSMLESPKVPSGNKSGSSWSLLRSLRKVSSKRTDRTSEIHVETEEASAVFISARPPINVQTAQSITISSSGPRFAMLCSGSTTPQQQPPPPPPPPQMMNSNIQPPIGSNNYLNLPLHRWSSKVEVSEASTVYSRQMEQFHAQLYSDVDYVIYPQKDPELSRQEYMDAKRASLIALSVQSSSSGRLSWGNCPTATMTTSSYGSLGSFGSLGSLSSCNTPSRASYCPVACSDSGYGPSSSAPSAPSSELYEPIAVTRIRAQSTDSLNAVPPSLPPRPKKNTNVGLSANDLSRLERHSKTGDLPMISALLSAFHRTQVPKEEPTMTPSPPGSRPVSWHASLSNRPLPAPPVPARSSHPHHIQSPSNSTTNTNTSSSSRKQSLNLPFPKYGKNSYPISPNRKPGTTRGNNVKSKKLTVNMLSPPHIHGHFPPRNQSLLSS